MKLYIDFNIRVYAMRSSVNKPTRPISIKLYPTRNTEARTLSKSLHPWLLNPVMVRRCEHVVRRWIYSPPFHSDDSGNLHPLRLVLASPSRLRSVIILSKMRSEEATIVVFVSIVLVVFFFFFFFFISVRFLERKKRNCDVIQHQCSPWPRLDIRQCMSV